MKNHTILIKNGTVVNSKIQVKKDVLISNGIIKKVEKDIQLQADRIIDASQKFIIPGVIDPQVHFREPGLTHKEDIKSGARAAVSGGVTTFFEMPNTNPATINSKLLEEKFKIAEKSSVANFSFFLGATPNNIDEIKNLKGNCGVKIFMGSSTGDLLVDRDSDIEQIFKYCNKVIAIHSEDEQVLNETAKTIKNPNFRDHPNMRPVKAAVTSTNKAINFALKYEKKLHVLHLSTSEEVKIIRKIKNTGLVTSETTPQHLLLSAPDIYNDIGSYAQMNPPIREKYHQEELWKGLFDGTINCIATDHAPHTIQEKNNPYGIAPSGMPGVETSLPLMLNQVNKGKIKLQDITKWMCENPAKIYQIKNKGFIEEGFDADIALIDLNRIKKIRAKNMQSKCGWSAFEGFEIKGWPIITIVNGNIVYENESINENYFGKRVTFGE
tara:strand:+ start:142 stop:1458 length:1317 start_codon:yes stop_codon:yes gene_type:complete